MRIVILNEAFKCDFIFKTRSKKSDCKMFATDFYFSSKDEATKIETSMRCGKDDDNEESLMMLMMATTTMTIIKMITNFLTMKTMTKRC